MANYRIFDNTFGGAGTGNVTGHLFYPNFGETAFEIDSTYGTDAPDTVPPTNGYDTGISTGGWVGFILLWE